MEILYSFCHLLLSSGSYLFNFIVHIDQHLIELTQQYGNWIYVLLFLIVFVETGLVVMPFLPGDSLLFVSGTLAGLGLLDFFAATFLMLIAAIAGDQTNYHIGRYFGVRVLSWQSSRFFNKQAFDKAYNFYDNYGGITIFVARFMPFIRTFAPFVAGIAKMQRLKFISYNVAGAICWVVGISTLGYFFGQTEIVKNNFEKVIWALILIPGLLVIGGHFFPAKSKDDVDV